MNGHKERNRQKPSEIKIPLPSRDMPFSQARRPGDWQTGGLAAGDCRLPTGNCHAPLHVEHTCMSHAAPSRRILDFCLCCTRVYYGKQQQGQQANQQPRWLHREKSR